MPGVTEAYSFVQLFNKLILYPTIALLSAVALLVFIYGAFEYVAMSSNQGAREKGVKHITWGIIGLVVMMSAYAILFIALNTFGLGDELECAKDPNKTGCVDVMAPPGNPGPVTTPGRDPVPGPVTTPGVEPTPGPVTTPGVR